MAAPPSHSQSLLPEPQKLILRRIERQQDRFVLHVGVQQAACCPRCRTASKSRHSAYTRTVQDLPWQGLAVEIRIKAHKFRCRNPACRQKIFAEPLGEVASRYGRRTHRVVNVIRLVGYTAGGLPGSRLLDRLAIDASDDTVLRAVKSSPSRMESTEAIHHLGVDDWAWRRGQNYGTILVDLERQRVVDLLPDRSAKSLKSWLHDQPTIQTVNRDRCGTYADGIANGAPGVVQIADRFHLAVNFSGAIERVLESHRQELSLPVSDPEPKHKKETTAASAKPPTAAERMKASRRCRRLERYQEVTERHKGGQSQAAIAEALGLSRKTVRRWLRSEGFPECKPPSGRRSHVREFDAYLRQRWNEGCHNATQLFREIRTRGYRGSRQMVSHHLMSWRADKVALPIKRSKCFAPKDIAILICKRPECRSAEQQHTLEGLAATHAYIHEIRSLASAFREALHGKSGQQMLEWIDQAISSKYSPLVRFAQGLRRDLKAVIAAVEYRWSSGQVEGQVNRLKMLKRQMYGRAGFPLLRARVLPYSSFGP